MASPQARHSLFGIVSQAVKQHGNRVALRSPFQTGPLETLTYSELRSNALKLATRLVNRTMEVQNENPGGSSSSSRPVTGVISDLPNTAENLLLQIACSRLGIAYCTVKDEAMFKAHQQLEKKGVIYGHSIASDTSSWLNTLPATGGSSLVGCTIVDCLFDDLCGESEVGGDVSTPPQSNQDAPHAFFNTATKPLLNSEIASLGEDASKVLHLTSDDKVCVSITLCHPFGIASGVSSVFHSGATLVLPAVGGIRGCGDPKERAEACLKVLEEEGCSVLFSDAPIMKQLQQNTPVQKLANGVGKLRTGVVKTGSGSDFLEDKMMFGNVEMWTMGKKA